LALNISLQATHANEHLAQRSTNTRCFTNSKTRRVSLFSTISAVSPWRGWCLCIINVFTFRGCWGLDEVCETDAACSSNCSQKGTVRSLGSLCKTSALYRLYFTVNIYTWLIQTSMLSP